MNEHVLAQPVADSTLHPLEQLAATNPDAEIWWDSSPLIFPSWKDETLAKAPEGERAAWDTQLTRFYDDASPIAGTRKASTVGRARADKRSRSGREWRMDGSILSRLETEWLVAWFYGRSRQMPPHVRERLQSLGFMDGVTLTAAGRRWLQTRGPDTTPNSRRQGKDGSGGGPPSRA
jgi:hypothetical protein